MSDLTEIEYDLIEGLEAGQGYLAVCAAVDLADAEFDSYSIEWGQNLPADYDDFMGCAEALLAHKRGLDSIAARTVKRTRDLTGKCLLRI